MQKFFPCVLVFFLLVGSCAKKENFSIPERPLFPVEQWFGLVQMVYLPVYSEIGEQGTIQTTLRNNDFVIIEQLRFYFNPKENMWQEFYFISAENGYKGWVPSRAITLYNHEATARKQAIAKVT